MRANPALATARTSLVAHRPGRPGSLHRPTVHFEINPLVVKGDEVLDLRALRNRCLLDAFDRCEPGLGAVVVDRDGEDRRLYRLDRPTVHKGCA
jgi:hypothetical protein